MTITETKNAAMVTGYVAAPAKPSDARYFSCAGSR